MEKEHFSLEISDDNRIIKVFRAFLGLLCIAIGIYWLLFNLGKEGQSSTQWISVAFLVGFGAYQIYAFLGLAVKFIEISSENIRLKKNSLFPVISFSTGQIRKIELFPLNVIFLIKPNKKVVLRFGISNLTKIEDIKRSIIEFADANGLPIEIMSEEILQ
jgi:hypothetical protein